MFIKRVEIDGFKSYARRVDIVDWDPYFNAITGLNGTGKSNILDSICFVLGIQNLGSIRAAQMIDLVYKQGQAGINKASVAITFDNSDKAHSPVGYQNCDEIVVRRQIIASNNRNTFTINGTAMPQTKVADFFRAIGLNVNNPHFLIMQGRVTLVMKMKPPEILGMLEEAAGTKLYDQKRDACLLTMRKKEGRIGEIEQLLNDDILPTVQKLKDDRTNYLSWQKIGREIELAERRLQGFIFYQSKIDEQKYKNKGEAVLKSIEASDEKTAELVRREAELERQRQELEEEKLQSEKNGTGELEGEHKAASDAVAKVESDIDALKARLNQTKKNMDREEKSMKTDVKELDVLKQQLAEMEKDKGDEEKQDNEAKERFDKARNRLAAIKEGKTTDEAGNAITVEAQINGWASELKELQHKLSNDDVRRGQLTNGLEEKRRRLQKMGRQSTDYQGEILRLNEEKQELKEQMKEFGYDPDLLAQKEEELHSTQVDLRRHEEREPTGAHGSSLAFQYYRQGLPANFPHEKILGRVAENFEVVDDRFYTALDTGGGGAIHQVIVTEQNVAKMLIDTRGALPSRTHFLPLDRIEARTLPAKTVAEAKKIAQSYGEECWLATELIRHDNSPGLEKAFQTVFGSIIICESSKVAEKITYGNLRATTVTLEGDKYTSVGTASGGFRGDKSNNYLRLAKAYRQWKSESAQKHALIKTLKAEIEALNQAKADADQLNLRINSIDGRLDLLQLSIDNNPREMLANDLQRIDAELAEIDERSAQAAPRVKELETKLTDAEKRKKNAKQFREDEEKKAKQELKAAQEALAALGDEVQRSKAALAQKRADVTESEKAISEAQESIKKLQDDFEEIKREIAAKDLEQKAVKAEFDAVKSRLEDLRGEKRKKEEELREIKKQGEEARKESIAEAERCKELKEKYSHYKEQASNMAKQYQHAMREYRWLADVEDQLAVKGTDFEFPSGFTADKGKKDVDDLKERQDKLSRNLNVKAMNLLAQAEDSVMTLLKKKETLYKDRKTLQETIHKLDEKRKEEISKAYHQVTKDMSSIFSTLLVNADAKLEPPAGMTEHQGLEIKVAFQGKWKESLTELSGGQKSLVALSLVLAMLKFKPAPLYILDEVDAALDISHTQNIGLMIKKHFTNSQFIIVSLKEGMFNNANVLFRTSFAEGTSRVDRFASKN